MTTQELLQAAKAAAAQAVFFTKEQKNNALLGIARALRADAAEILAANKEDLDAAQGKISPVMLDRLALNPARIESMAKGVEEVAALEDPVGKTLAKHTAKSDIVIEKVSVPLGVVAIIYESRPNVTSDAAALTLKAGSVCVLRCGKEAHKSAAAITRSMRRAVGEAGLPQDMILLVEDLSRKSAEELMQARGYVDLLIPRGGKSLIETCVRKACVPCIETGTGICHIYVDQSADTEKALAIIENAKISRPSVCNAAEVVLVHQAIAKDFLPKLSARLCGSEATHPVTLRCDANAAAILGIPADPEFDTEFLDYVLAVGVVATVEEAVRHIAQHSTHHSDAILTQDEAAARYFTAAVDSAAVYVNASTRFTDGGEFGLGCEMGISTQKLHARGPMGLCELVSYKYIIRGDGQIRV